MSGDPFAGWDRPAFPSNGPTVAWFIERYCTHAKGEWFGQPLVMEPWQRWLLNEMFRIDPDTQMRHWRQVLLLLPRKNSKSTMIAALGFYFLVYDDEGGPEVFSAAWGEQQARVVFDSARTMWDASRNLQAKTQKFARALTCPENAGSWRVVSKLADLMQGTNPHAALLDELHVHQRSDLYDAFLRGTQARRQPMICGITTEGNSKDGTLGKMQQGYIDAAEWEEVAPMLHVAKHETSRSLMVRWGIPWDSDADIDDPEVVRACNPASWLDPQRLISEYLKAPGATERDFRRYHLNQLVESSGSGIAGDDWDACTSPVGLVPGQEVTVGIDIGWVDDWSAVVAAGLVGDRVVLEAHLFRPPDGGELELEDVFQQVLAIAERYRVREVAYDPYAMAHDAQRLYHLGLLPVKYTQEAARMCPASRQFFELVKTQRLAHDGNTDFRSHVLNAEIRDVGMAWKFAKPKDRSRKIDGLMAAIMATDRLLSVPDDPYANGGGVFAF